MMLQKALSSGAWMRSFRCALQYPAAVNRNTGGLVDGEQVRVTVKHIALIHFHR
jgi:hypothetical protein